MRFQAPYHQVFDSWSQDMAYALGLMFTDGCVHEKLSSVDFTNTDKAMHQYWKSNRSIFKRRRTNSETQTQSKLQYTTGVTSAHMVQRLIQLGVLPRKSKMECPLPKVPEDYLLSFVLGLLDGDGSIQLAKVRKCVGGVNLRVTFVTAWTEVAEEFSRLLGLLQIRARTTPRNGASGTAESRVTGREAEKLCALLYDNSSRGMLRKRRCWQRYFKLRHEYGGLILDAPIQKRRTVSYPWAGQLGNLPDTQLALEVGLSKSRIGQIRADLGISPFRLAQVSKNQMEMTSHA